MFKMKLGNKSQVDPEEINVKFNDVKGVGGTLYFQKNVDLKHKLKLHNISLFINAGGRRQIRVNGCCRIFKKSR